MPNLTNLVQVIPSSADEEPEDIFQSAPGLIFTDDLRDQHGDPGSTIVYKSSHFGDIELRTADPEGERERTLFSHYLWNAGIKTAELISSADDEGGNSKWSVKGRKVLELGAGVGLGGIVATLAGAEHVTITDYPAEVVLKNIESNASSNITRSLKDKYSIQGHVWGELDSAIAKEYRGHFDCILAADCYWMPHQHANLVASMLYFLSHQPGARVNAIAGFHTGRKNVADFFQTAEAQGLHVDEIYEEDAEGVRREWLTVRDGGYENPTERRKWLVIGILRRR